MIVLFLEEKEKREEKSLSSNSEIDTQQARCSTPQSSHSTTQHVIYMPSTLTMGFIILVSSLLLMCLRLSLLFPLVCSHDIVGSVASCIALLHSSVSKRRVYISVVFSLLIMDCFGLCPLVVFPHRGFSTSLNHVSCTLYHLCILCFCFVYVCPWD